jgi:hypothetical protein
MVQEKLNWVLCNTSYVPKKVGNDHVKMEIGEGKLVIVSPLHLEKK